MADRFADGRWMRRGFLGLPLVVWMVLAVATAALAVVGFFVTLGMTGYVATGDGIDVEFVAMDPIPCVDGTTAGSISASATTTEVNLELGGLISNDYVYCEVHVINNGPEDAALQTWLSGQDPASVHVNLDGTISGSYCGVVIPGDGTETIVGFQVTIQEGATPGYSYTWLGAPNDGLQFVRADLFDPGGCF